MVEQSPRPDQEGFGEAGLGEAQSENPPADPDMLRDDEGEGEEAAEDQDAGPTAAPEQVEGDSERDQAEG
jgi:hypothetical protein